MKKMLCAWLTAFLVLNGFPGISAETDNLLKNSGFEDVDIESGVPKEWETFNGWTNDENPTSTRQVHTRDNPHDGTYCTKIWIDNDRNQPYVWQSVENLTPGATYAVGYWIRAISEGQARFQLQLEYKIGNEVETLTTLPSVPNTKWTLYSQEFIIPEKVDSVTIKFKLFGQNTVFIDDVFLKFISVKPSYTIETDAVFYYSDDTSPAVSTVTAQEPGNKTVTFALKDKDGKTKYSMDNVPFTDGKASFSFSVQNALETSRLYYGDEKPYTVEAVISDGTVLTETVYRYDRPTRIQEDGTYVLNGETVTPVSAHSIDVDENEYKKVKEIGINVVTVSAWWADFNGTVEVEGKDIKRIDHVLQLLHDNELMCILGLYRNMVPSAHSFNKTNTSKIVNYISTHKYKDHVFAYTMMDEPLQNDRPAGERLMEEGYRQIRRYESEIPVLLVDAHKTEKDTRRVTKYCDIYACDAYYSGNGEFSSWPGEIVKMSCRVADEGKRPVYFVAQAFEFNGQFPTAVEICHTIYQALLAGAKGFGYYTINEATKDMYDNSLDLYETDRWEGLYAFAKSAMPEVQAHFIEGKYSKVSDVVGNGYSGRIWNKNETIYILLLNHTEAKTTATISLPFREYLISRFGEQPFKYGKEGMLTCSLAPREAVLMTVSEVGKMNFYRTDGTVVDAPSPGETVEARLYLPTTDDVTCYIGAYDMRRGKKEMIAFEPMAKEVSAHAITYSALIFAPLSENITYRCFYWDAGLCPRKQEE